MPRADVSILFIFKTLLFCFGASSLLDVVASDVDNGVLGSPAVECGRDFVHFKVATKKAFDGRVYVKGEFENPSCMKNMVKGGKGGGGEEGEEEEKSPRKWEGNDGWRAEAGRKPTNPGKEEHKKQETDMAGRGKEAGGRAEDDRRKQKSGGGDGEEGGGGKKNGGGTVPEGEEEEEGRRGGGGGGGEGGGGTEDRREAGEGREPAEEEVDEDTVRQILQELQKRRNSNQDGAQRQIPSHLPGFGSAEQLKRWRSFLRGKPGLDGQGFRRYGSRLSPDANGECPLVCPPCDECDGKGKSGEKEGNGSRRGGRQRRLAGEHSAELKIPLGECNTRRDRMANPPGMQVSFTVVVSFHPNFITRVDRAYNIQCAYQEPERLLSTQIDVSPPPIIELSSQMESPQCEYRIHGQSSIDQIRNVRVGDMVQHEWACHGGGGGQQQRDHPPAEESQKEQRMAAQFGLLVHDCFVDDGKSRREQVVDAKGCSIEPQILPTPEYSSDTLRASILSPVAKFPDGDLFGFQCSITVCMRDMGNCDGVTPPDCSSTTSRKGPKEAIFGAFSSVNRTKRSLEVEQRRSLDWQLNSPLMTVFDPTERTQQAEQDGKLSEFSRDLLPALRPPSRLLPAALPPSQLCLSLPLFTLLVSTGTFLATISAGTLFAVLLFSDYSLSRRKVR